MNKQQCRNSMSKRRETLETGDLKIVVKMHKGKTRTVGRKCMIKVQKRKVNIRVYIVK